MKSLLRILPRISTRLLAFNILLVFLPVGGILFLDTYEQHLLKAQERTMTQEGRLLAAAIEATGRIDKDDARKILVHLGRRHIARLRVLNFEGTLLADSASLGPRKEPDDPDNHEIRTTAEEGLLYRIGSMPFRLWRGPGEQSDHDLQDHYARVPYLEGPEVIDALNGRYGASTRINGASGGRVNLFIAIPIRLGEKVHGVVLVSQSTTRILGALHAVRVDVFKVSLAGVGAAIVISLLLALTIARPLTRLRRRAEAILDRKGRLRGSFEPSGRLDEIGDLERALAELTRRLEGHLRYTESFAADFSHELKNPLGSIRSAADLLREEEDKEQQERFLDMILRDIARVERLLSGAKEISHIDVEIEEEDREPVPIDELLTVLVDGFRLRLGNNGPRIILVIADQDVIISASPDRLSQVFENLIGNACSFTCHGGSVQVSFKVDNGNGIITVVDDGPGIPPEHLDRIFTRFFSYRPDAPDEEHHIGLGLAMVKTITEAYGGSVAAANSPKGGAIFTLTLPVEAKKTF